MKLKNILLVVKDIDIAHFSMIDTLLSGKVEICCC